MKSEDAQRGLCQTGIAGLDELLGGGLPRDRLYLVQGDPGVGKTTLALQFLLTGAKAGEKGLYITLSETRSELVAVADSHGWSLEPLAIIELSALDADYARADENTFFHAAEVDLDKTTKILTDEVDRVRPVRVVFDSLSEMRLLAETSLRYRRQILALKQFFAGRHSTIMLLEDNTTGDSELHIQSLAHGVIALEKIPVSFGAHRRRLHIEKMRGVKFLDGAHDYTISRGGLDVFPRLVAARHHREFTQLPVSSGIPELDSLLGGGLHRGTSTLLIGPAGTGKSTLAMQQLLSAARRGERSAVFLFDENMRTLQTRLDAIGMSIEEHIKSGLIWIQQVDPAELPPGEFAHIIRNVIEQRGVEYVLIDSLNGYLHAMPNEAYLSLQLHEMLTYMSQLGIVSIMTLAQHGVIGSMQTPVDVTYLADTVVMLRYFESGGAVKKAISVVKKRSGSHENSIREYRFDRSGLRLGLPLAEFSGVLTGTPSFHGASEAILGLAEEKA